MKTPALSVGFTVSAKGIEQITLRLANQFTLAIEGDQRHNARINSWIDAYLARQEPTTELPLVLSHLPPFTKRVLEQLATVPFGQVLSYQELAQLANNPRAARAVGNACNRNPHPLVIPCHRVIHTNGGLGGFRIGLQIKQVLLDHEEQACPEQIA